jgi:tetratricopeptide (TPR) repeat protein
MPRVTKKSVELYNKAVLDYKNKNYVDALEKFLRYLEFDSKDPQVRIAIASCYNNIGVEEYKKNRADLALKYFKKASEIEPTNQIYKNNIEIAKQKINYDKLEKLTFKLVITIRFVPSLDTLSRIIPISTLPF